MAAAAPTLSLERLCERIVSDHDYDLAVLAQWDGRRRYANLRKLARMARSYEERRGPDVQGFVRFVAEQDAVGASELPDRKGMEQDRARDREGRDHNGREAAELAARPVRNNELQGAWRAQDTDADRDREIDEAEDVPRIGQRPSPARAAGAAEQAAFVMRLECASSLARSSRRAAARPLRHRSAGTDA